MRSHPHRLNRRFHGAVGGDHDHDAVGISPLDLLQGLEPSDAREHQVQDDEVVVLVVQHLET